MTIAPVEIAVASIAVFALLTCGTPSSELDDPRTYVFEGDVTFELEYPRSWSATRDVTTVSFVPPDPEHGHIDVIVYDPALSPPLPVHITYDTLRVVDSPHGFIPVMKRDPSAVTERYFATLRIDGHVAEFRHYAEREYDAVFDHMLVTTNPITSP